MPIKFNVTVRTPRGEAFAYSAIAAHAFDLIDAALEVFGVCKVMARPA